MNISHYELWVRVYRDMFCKCQCACRPASCVLCWDGRISSLVSSEELDRSCWASIREQCSVLMPSIARRISPTCKAPHLRKTGEDSKRETDSGGNKERKSFVLSKARNSESENDNRREGVRWKSDCERRWLLNVYYRYMKNRYNANIMISNIN